MLSESGIQLVEIKMESIESMFDGLDILGSIVKRTEQAEKLIAQMRAELDVIQQQYNEADTEKLPKVFIEIWSDPITTASGKSFVDDIWFPSVFKGIIAGESCIFFSIISSCIDNGITLTLIFLAPNGIS